MNSPAPTAMDHPSMPSFDLLAQAQRIERQKRQRALVKDALGLGLLAASLTTRARLTRALLGTTGSLVLLRGLTGRNLKENVQAVKRALGPKTALQFGNGKRDLVDQASWESFPASDAPGY